jgi:hypothetical protein
LFTGTHSTIPDRIETKRKKRQKKNFYCSPSRRNANITFEISILVRLTTVELGAQLLSSSDSILIQSFNQTDKDLLHQSSSSAHFLFNSLSSNNGQLRLREHQLIRLTCVVSRALPAAYINFPFDIDYRVEKNSTQENDDKTYRTIVVFILRINRYFHKRTFHCEAIQTHVINDETKQHHRILSNSIQMDVVCKYRSKEKKNSLFLFAPKSLIIY